ncbi:MAG: hypothetical protein ACE5I7_20150, partial [Candidatus Binatia bacterium]
AFPAFSLLSAFGQAAPLNRELQRAGRVLPFPFHFLDNNKCMNVRPSHYSWTQFYDHLVDLTRYAFSSGRIYHRLRANCGVVPKGMNLIRAISSEGFGRLRYHRTIRGLLDSDATVRGFLEGERDVLPEFYSARIRHDLGPLWEALPPGALVHDHNAYLKSSRTSAVKAHAPTSPTSARGNAAVSGCVVDGVP